MRGLFLIPLLVASVTSVSAQQYGSAPHFSPRFPGHAGGSRVGFYPVSFFPESDYGHPGDLAGPQPPVIVLQSPPPAEPVQPYVPAQPLMIELQGGRYVRVSGEDAAMQFPDQRRSIPVSGNSESPDFKAAGLSASAETRRSVLVFTDGHREELGRYTISSGVLYAESDVYTGGAWTQSVQLSSLDLPKTVSENQSRGIPFKLPSAPNEVIVGP